MPEGIEARYARLLQAARFRAMAGETLLAATELDRARIVQSAPVRRLQQKTQVFPLDVKASVRSRLTHSLEVQQAGRQIVRAILEQLPLLRRWETVLLNLVEMACLLHDVGNPPFGHFGEAVCRHWLAEQLPGLFVLGVASPPTRQWHEQLLPDLLAFDGNAQSLRLVHSVQGLNLTFSLLAALIKYPYACYGQTPGQKGKAGYFFSEQALMRQLRQTLGLAEGRRHPLVYVMEAADDISYCIADLEDAVDRRLLSQGELLGHLTAGLPGDPYLGCLLTRAQEGEEGFFPAFRRYLTEDLVQLLAERYVRSHEAILAGESVAALADEPAPAARVLRLLKRVAREQVFRRREVEALELEGHAALRGVLNHYASLLRLSRESFGALGRGGSTPDPLALRLYHRLPPRHLAAYHLAMAGSDNGFTCEREREWYFRTRLLLDFISGMTDTYLLEEYRLLSGI